MDSLIVPTIWLVQEGTNFTQIEVTMVEEARFFLCKQPKCPPRNLFGDEKCTIVINQTLRCLQNLFGDGSFALVNILLDVDV